MLWSVLPDHDDFEPPPEKRSLPSRPWPRSLRSLCTHWHILANSSSALTAAERLEYLCMGDIPDANLTEAEAWGSLWGWAERHPPPFSLAFNDQLGSDDPMPACLYDSSTSLVQRRPRLIVFHRFADGHPDAFLEEVLRDSP